MKKVLKILFYFSVILITVILFISKDSTKRDEITKVITKQESNTSEKIEKIKEIQKQINKKLTVNAGDDQNITFGKEVSLNAIVKDSDGDVMDYLWKEDNKTLSQEQSFDYKFNKGVHHLNVTVTDNEGAKAEDNIIVNVGYWKLVKVEIQDKSISYEYNNDKKIIKAVIDNNKEGTAHRVWKYMYDDKGRETYGTNYYKGKVLDRNFSNQFTDDGKIKEKNILYYSRGEIYGFTNTKITYDDNGNGNILKEIEVRSDLYENGGLLVEYEYEKKYYYSDTDQLLEIIGMLKGKEEMHIKYQYEDERLVSTRGTYRITEHNGGEDYIYEDGVLREIYSFDTNYGYRKFYNEDGLVEEKKDFAFGSSYEKIKYFYDEDGKKIKEEQYSKDNNGEFEQISYTIFDDEKSQKVFLNSDKVEITYDKKLHLGRVLIEKRRDVYDEHGNLIEIWDDVSNKLIERRFYRFVIGNN